MSLTHSPKMVSDGLLAAFDALNVKSFPGTGANFYDLTKNFTGTISNTALITFNTMGYFDFSTNDPSTGNATTGQGITMPAVIVPTTGSFTIAAWIKRDITGKAAGDRETIFSNTGSADGFRFGINNTGTLYYLIGGVGSVGYSEGGVGGGYTVFDGQWHNVVLVFDRAATLGAYQVIGYVDGVKVGFVNISSTNTAFTASTPGIGIRGCCRVFAGQIAIVLVYGKALNDEEISQNYITHKGRFGK